MAASKPPTGLTSAQKSAKAIIQGTLGQYGLGGLAEQAWQWYLGGATVDQVMLDIRNTDTYKARFPAMAELAKQGRAISEAQYIDYERNAAQVMQRYGLPKGFSDSPDDFASLLTGNVSVAELDQRLQLQSQIANNTDPETLAVLQRDYGLDQGHLLAYTIDPKNALPILQRDFLAAQIGGAADRTGFGAGKTTNEYLATLGISADQAQQGFGQLAANEETFGARVGTTDEEIGRDTQVAGTFAGDASATQRLQRRQRERQAEFAGGGGYTSSQKGFTGVGSAKGA